MTTRTALPSDTLLATLLSDPLAAALLAAGIETLEDLYECVAARSGTWYRSVSGVSREDAMELVRLLADNAENLGEVPEHFFPPAANQRGPSTELVPALQPASTTGVLSIALPDALSGRTGTNRTEESALAAQNDAEAIDAFLKARAANPNTLMQYRREAERFLLWCTMECGTALSSLTADQAALYPRWLEGLGRTREPDWAARWNLPQSAWIGPKNEPRLSEFWRPFNGPLTASSRKTAMTIVRLMFVFLTKTAYLRFNPFDQVSAKMHLLPGEGAPKDFADRSLTDSQWLDILTYLESLPDTLATRRMRVVLSLGKGLGMRASEMVSASAGWITLRRIGDEEMLVIEIVGKGDKIRRLPVSPSVLAAINSYFAMRGLPTVESAPPATPILENLGTGRQPAAGGISRSGLYRALTSFFQGAAAIAEERSPADAAKLRAGSTHWLRHTFATTALKSMDLNVVQNALGHASIGTTSRYLTPEEAQIARAMRRVRDPLAPPPMPGDSDQPPSS